MQRGHIVHVLIISMALCVASIAAQGADFNIKVPVRMYKMVQGVGKVKVTCEVLDAQNQRISMASKWSTNHVNHTPAGLEEDIIVSMDAYADKDPRTAAKYVCDLKIQTAWVQDQPWQTPSENAQSRFLQPKPGTAFRVTTSGLLYPQKKSLSRKAPVSVQRRVEIEN